jgi:hypothetical protein
VTEDSRCQLVCQAAIYLGEPTETSLQCNLEWSPAAYREENSECGSARSESSVGQPSIPATGDDGIATSRRGILPAR